MLELLGIMKLGNIHPLHRQYLSVILARLYVQVSEQCRAMLVEEITSQQKQGSSSLDLNTHVPILLTLGDRMLSLQQREESGHEEIFEIFLKFISCHHAYIRSIAQYHISQYIRCAKEANKAEDFGFLDSLVFIQWEQDKDCLKIMKNIGSVVGGFKSAVKANETSISYLHYERVEEYPNPIVENRLHKDLLEIIKCWVKEMPLQPRVRGMLLERMSQLEECIQAKEKEGVAPLQLRHKDPEIIILATLLEKVHNFGHILRTLHKLPQKDKQNIMVVVPSRIPLEHPECQELIPPTSTIQVVEIKEQDLSAFIGLYKKLGYPLIGLEQCAGSVRIEEFKFPQKYMLLLGNERIGAPASLLGQADTLV